MATVADLAALSNWAYDPSTNALQAIGDGNWVERGIASNAAAFRVITVGVVLCWISLAAPNPAWAQTPTTVPATAPVDAPSQTWKSCAARLSAVGDPPMAALQAQFERPKNIAQMLQNLKLAWDNDWMLRPEFYDDETLLNFFNGVAISWKQRQTERFPAEEIALETNSRVLPQMSIALEAHCRAQSFPQPNGHEKTILTLGGNFRIYGPPIPELTLATIRQVLGPETQNQLDVEFAGGSEIGHVPTDKGSVVYTDPAKEQLEGSRLGLAFYFRIPSKRAESFPNKIAADDVVQAIVLSDGRHRTMEN